MDNITNLFMLSEAWSLFGVSQEIWRHAHHPFGYGETETTPLDEF